MLIHVAPASSCRLLLNLHCLLVCQLQLQIMTELAVLYHHSWEHISAVQLDFSSNLHSLLALFPGPPQLFIACNMESVESLVSFLM